MFVVLAAIWFFASVITGSFLWRMGINVVFFYITVIFMIGLLSIKSFIAKINTKDQFKPNHQLMNVNLGTFTGEFVIYLVVLIMAV